MSTRHVELCKTVFTCKYNQSQIVGAWIIPLDHDIMKFYFIVPVFQFSKYLFHVEA